MRKLKNSCTKNKKNFIEEKRGRNLLYQANFYEWVKIAGELKTVCELFIQYNITKYQTRKKK